MEHLAMIGKEKGAIKLLLNKIEFNYKTYNRSKKEDVIIIHC